jgi:hypothetical protein
VESALAVALATSGISGKKRSSSEARMRRCVSRKLAVEARVGDAAVAEGVVAVAEVVAAVIRAAAVVEGEVAKVEDSVAAAAAAAAEVEVGDNLRRQRMPSGTSKTRQAAEITIGRSKLTRRTKFDIGALWRFQPLILSRAFSKFHGSKFQIDTLLATDCTENRSLALAQVPMMMKVHAPHPSLPR